MISICTSRGKTFELGDDDVIKSFINDGSLVKVGEGVYRLNWMDEPGNRQVAEYTVTDEREDLIDCIIKESMSAGEMYNEIAEGANRPRI